MNRTFLDTAHICEDERLHFATFVLEADGGFGRTALAVLAKLADDAAKLTFGGGARDARGAIQ